MQFIKRFQTQDGTLTFSPSLAVEPQNTQTPSSSPSPNPVDHGGVVLEIPSSTPSPSPSGDLKDNATAKASPSPSPSAVPSPSPAASNRNVRNSKVYFLTRKSNDSIELASVSRQVVHENAPLTGTLAVLLKGPTKNEKRSSIISLIPEGTKLEDVYVKGDTAFISFNQEFRYNDYGVPGLKAQLKQVIYTATEFSNIGKVQILIDGKKIDYLAQEGVYVGAPLSRSSF
ncbi:MAG: GerMN domain-containing protein [Spirochaetales bacterium]|nr:GerMN domain-containing protein [Spirochaetales bacterium]